MDFSSSITSLLFPGKKGNIMSIRSIKINSRERGGWSSDSVVFSHATTRRTFKPYLRYPAGHVLLVVGPKAMCEQILVQTRMSVVSLDRVHYAAGKQTVALVKAYAQRRQGKPVVLYTQTIDEVLIEQLASAVSLHMLVLTCGRKSADNTSQFEQLQAFAQRNERNLMSLDSVTFAGRRDIQALRRIRFS
jgi:hypothetical protein